MIAIWNYQIEAGCSEGCIPLRMFNQSFFTFSPAFLVGLKTDKPGHDSDGPDDNLLEVKDRTEDSSAALAITHVKHVLQSYHPQFSYPMIS